MVARIALLCVSTLVTLVLAELAFTFIAPVPDPYRDTRQPSPNSFIRTQRPPLDTYNVRVVDSLPGVPLTATYGTNNVGYRGPPLLDPKPAGEYRVILVGGSTTENRILDDSVALNAVLQQRLRELTGRPSINVYSSGVAGHRSDDNVSMMAHRIAHQEPDLIVVFAGINDLLAAMQGLDYEHFGPDPGAEAQELSPVMLLKLLATERQIPRRLIYLARALRGQSGTRVNEMVTTDFANGVASMRAAPTATDQPSTDLKSFADNLRTMIGIARAHHADIVLMTQYTTWGAPPEASSSWQWLRFVNGVTYPEAWMDTAMEAYNDATRSVGAAEGAPVFDLAQKLEKSSRYAFDDAHFTPEGSRVTGRELAQFLVQNVASLRPKS